MTVAPRARAAAGPAPYPIKVYRGQVDNSRMSPHRSAVRRYLVSPLVLLVIIAPVLGGALPPLSKVSQTSSVSPVDPTPSKTTVSRVSVCGRWLCAGGSRHIVRMGSINGLADSTKAPGWATALRLNTLRLTDFLDTQDASPRAAYDPIRWAAVDRMIAASRAAGLHVELDLSTYRNQLLGTGINPYTHDWKPFLTFVAQRRNTVTGVRYGVDPTVALVSFAGEVEPINSSTNPGISTAGLTEFFRTVLAQYAALAPRQLLSTGGLLQLDWDSGIDWRALMRLPHNSVPAIHLYSDADRSITVPAFADYAAQLGKPWLNEEFGAPASIGDDARATLFANTYQLTDRYGAAGNGIWNVGPQTTDTFDVGPQFPLTYAVVRSY